MSMNNEIPLQNSFWGRLFIIPDYQRGYSWEENQLKELVEDIELMATGTTHYTGQIVLLSRNENGHAETDADGTKYSNFHVVDGQQRLTTLIIFMDAIQNKLKSLSDPSLVQKAHNLADGIRKTFVASQSISGLDLYKLKLNSDCRLYFQESIVASPAGQPPLIASHERLEFAKKFFENYLNGKQKPTEEAYFDYLRDLYDRIAHRLTVTVYEVTQESEVGLIFETMNNRGKPLNELDKLKAFLIYLAFKNGIEVDRLIDDIKITWKLIFESLMNAKKEKTDFEDQLLRSHWIMAYDNDSRNWIGSKSVRRKLNLKDYSNRQKDLVKNILDYTKSLRDSLNAYCDICNPHGDKAFGSLGSSDNKSIKEIKKASDKLLRINVLAIFLPLLMATRIRFPSEAAKYIEILQVCEKLAFRVYRLLGYRADAGRAMLFKMGYQLYNNEISFDVVIENLRALTLRYCPTRDFEVKFALKDDYNDWYNWSGLKYFLYEYEESLAGNKDVQFPWDFFVNKSADITIEHILPRQPNRPYWEAKWDQTARQKYTHDIGNLALTPDNSVYGNKDFHEKKTGLVSNYKQDYKERKPCYANGALFMERELADFEDWDEKALLKRREKIVTWALKRWHIEKVSTDKISQIEFPDNGKDE